MSGALSAICPGAMALTVTPGLSSSASVSVRNITAACRKHGVGGTVQHGASTLPEKHFVEFPRNDAIEINLATEFQRIVFDHPKLPKELRDKMVAWIKETKPAEWKEGDSEAKNIEKCFKRAWGPVKKDFWSMPSDAKGRLSQGSPWL